MSKNPDTGRLSREVWLEKALEALAESPTHLRVDHLAEKLGVSKGSFYFHFKGRAEFVYALAEYWRDAYTSVVADAALHEKGTPEEKLYFLMQTIIGQGASGMDIPVRALARIEPDIMPVIREVDEIRLQTLRELFAEMGFEGTELEMRTRIFVACHSMDASLAVKMSREEALAQLDDRAAFFTRR
ncbi:MAG: TetR/AcrR family transcriptional regulator [Woeseiaceae bacterium]|nr:TetR/AcrR family transcriptional regulator [Woeseiaceae bacterium]